MFTDRQPLIDEICTRLCEGEPLAQICRDVHMPSDWTVREWCKADESFSTAIARARDIGFDVIAADCLRIADTTQQGTTVTAKEWGDEVKTGDMLEHRKLRIETRLKLLAKWDPKRYGDKQQVEHSGSIDTAGAIIASRRARNGG